MPDTTLSAAIREAYASAVCEPVLYTLEFRHPAFTTPIRVVRDKIDLLATLEADAPIDAGVAVTFIACAFELQLPEVSEASAPDMLLTIDNVAAEMMPYLDLAAQSLDPIEVSLRIYLRSDASAPQNDPPVTLTVKDVRPDVFRVEATVGNEDPASRRFPRETFTAARFVGLSA